MEEQENEYFIPVERADGLIKGNVANFGEEVIPLFQSAGRILAEPLMADRDFPPFNRATMDGIAIKFDGLIEGDSFTVKGLQAAGHEPLVITDQQECIEIMTGAALDDSVDTVVPYEDLEIKNGKATVVKNLVKRKGQNIHIKGIDFKKDNIIVAENHLVTPAIIAIAASIGKINLRVRSIPKIVILTTGDEMISSDTSPKPYQLRRSNDVMLRSALLQNGIQSETIHLEDNFEIIKSTIKSCFERFQIIITTGGVSMGKFDYVFRAFEELKIERIFHKIKQRPGKPFWFGVAEKDRYIFGFPGNPVSAFLCFTRYFVPWYKQSQGVSANKEFAFLAKPVEFRPALTYFIQVRVENKSGQLIATPIEGHGSGDFINMGKVNAFMELPAEKNEFREGEVYRVWRF